MAEEADVFVLNEETEDDLRRIFQADQPKLERLRARIAQARVNQKKIEALTKKLEALRQKNNTLRETTGLEEEGEEVKVEISTDDKDEFDEKTFDPDSPKYPSDWWTSSFSFANKGPTMKGMISSVLEEKLYRILTDKGEWAFYNDSLYYQVHVTYELSKESTITPGPISKITVQQNGAMEVSLVLYPEETAILFSGTVKNFENKSKAILLPATYQSPSNVLVETQEKRRLNIKLEAKNAGLEALSTEQAVQLCVQQNLPFVDEQFPPDVTSLFRDKVDSVVPPLLWRTFRDYLPSEAHAQARLFCGDITPFRVEMGKGLENTNIISAIQIAAEFPEVIRRLFLHPDGAKAGKLERAFNAFRVQLCKNGWWTNVVVDGYVPAAAHCPEFARIKDDLRCLWLPFLEKSLAKLYGSYSALLVAPSETGLSNLTGTPHTPLTSFWPKQATNAAEVQKLAQLIQRQFANGGQLMLTAFPLSTANTKEKKDRLEAAYKQLGLVPGFSVCVLGVHEIAGTLLVRIRENGSPDCGKRNWLKVWYGAKKPWVDDVEKEIFARGEEGVLWMEIGDLPQYFKGGFFFYPQLNDWSTVRVQGVLTEGVPSVCMKVSVKEKLQGVLCVTQPDLLSTSSVFSTDNLEDMLADETVAPIGLHIFGKKGATEESTWISGNNSPDIFEPSAEPRFVFAEHAAAGVELVPENSPYYIVPRVRDKTGRPVSYVLSAFFKEAPPCSTGGGLSVDFVSLKSSCPIYNSAKANFKGQTDAQTVQVEHQYRWGDEARTQTKTGESLVTM